MNLVQARIFFEHLPGTGPEHEGIDDRVRKMQPQLVNEWRGEERIADSRERDDEYLHPQQGVFRTGLGSRLLDLLHICCEAHHLNADANQRLYMFLKNPINTTSLIVSIILMIQTKAATAFTYSDFSSTAGLNLVGTAAQSGSALRLTPTGPDHLG